MDLVYEALPILLAWFESLLLSFLLDMNLVSKPCQYFFAGFES
jgi:hypothetical protein